MVCLSHAEAPGASCWPQYHMVRWTGPLGTLVVAGPGPVAGVDTAGPAFWLPLEPPHAASPSASTPASAQVPQTRTLNDSPLATLPFRVAIATSLASRAISSIKTL